LQTSSEPYYLNSQSAVKFSQHTYQISWFFKVSCK